MVSAELVQRVIDWLTIFGLKLLAAILVLIIVLRVAVSYLTREFTAAM